MRPLDAVSSFATNVFRLGAGRTVSGGVVRPGKRLGFHEFEVRSRCRNVRCAPRPAKRWSLRESIQHQGCDAEEGEESEGVGNRRDDDP